jgi:hypothetical protein
MPGEMKLITRRAFLERSAGALLAVPFGLQLLPGVPTDWDGETPLAQSVREYLEDVFIGRKMALDFRRINDRYDEEFRIQINAFDLFPVASCFKSWLALYYYLNTPVEVWQDSQGSSLYDMVVFSNNLQAGAILAEVARRIPNSRNPIEKFNDFLQLTVGMANGLYSWDWPDSPTVGFTDVRFLPSDTRGVQVNDRFFLVDNVLTAADLAHGYDVLTRGDAFAEWEKLREAIEATDRLLSIPAAGYQSPFEYVFVEGYMGKDGILPEANLPAGLGRVVNDAGVVTIDDAQYIIAFMSIGENELAVREVLGEIARLIDIYERGRRTMTLPLRNG